MTKDEALKKAFKQAFQLGQDYWYQADHEYESQNKKSDVTRAKFEQLMEDAIKEALAQPEPVAWEQFYPDMGKPKLAYLPPTGSSENACYIPPSTWVELTDDEIQSLDLSNYVQVVRIVQAKLKAKNT